MKLSLSKVVLLATALAFLPGAVTADLVASSPLCSFSVVSLQPGGVTPVCLGSFPGNNLNQEADVFAAMTAAGWGSPWYDLGTTNQGVDEGPFEFYASGVADGTLIFRTPISAFYPFVLALKAANRFSLFYFGAYAGGLPLTGIEYTTAGVSANVLGVPQGLSHATLYSTSTVPEPATVFLLATGLLGLGIVERRRRKA